MNTIIEVIYLDHMTAEPWPLLVLLVVVVLLAKWMEKEGRE
jgi:hypothetical protein